MFEVKNNFSLKEYNSFHFDVSAAQYVKLTSAGDCREWIFSGRQEEEQVLVLGGGSNLLFSGDFSGVILHPAIDHIKIEEENSDEVFIEAGAGKVWDEFVRFCVENNFYGVENLSFIPGTVGASPVQNIGAYGTEVKDVIEKVNGIYLDSGKEFVYITEQCRFGYRNSIFKEELKGRVVITSVVFRLSKRENYVLHYGHLEEKVKERGVLNIKNVRDTVISIRESKLPDPEKTGNAGSFFKNPEVTKEHYRELLVEYNDMPGYKTGNGLIKVPAGWMIDRAGWKGKKMGQAGVHPNQALVLINLGNATGNDILELARVIEKDIYDKFRISLEKEVNVI